ncbi:hypothetical protein QTP88_028136 [Uroleucon formosanum]
MYFTYLNVTASISKGGMDNLKCWSIQRVKSTGRSLLNTAAKIYHSRLFTLYKWLNTLLLSQLGRNIVGIFMLNYDEHLSAFCDGQYQRADDVAQMLRTKLRTHHYHVTSISHVHQENPILQFGIYKKSHKSYIEIGDMWTTIAVDVFCSKHSDCGAPISVITNILSKNDPLKFQYISNEFDKLGFTKVKDLAVATLGKANSIKLPGDTLTLLYGAIEIYSEHLDNCLKSAKSELQNRNFINTQKICKELLRHKPNDLKVILVNAKSYFDCGNYEECIDCLEKAKKINPKCSEVLSNFALVYMKKSENDLARQYLSEVCEIKPFCANTWTDFADFLFETNDLYSAELAYVRVLSLNPELNKVRNKYGKLLLKLNKIKEAKDQFKIAHNYASECSEILNNLADVYYKSGKFEKAIAKYKKVLEINPNLINACFCLGMAYLKVTEYQNAANAFLTAIDIELDNVSVLKNLAVTYCRLGNMVLCAETYKKCLILQSENLNLNLELALIYLHNIKNYQEAAIYFKKCIELNPERLDVYENLFAAYRKLMII